MSRVCIDIETLTAQEEHDGYLAQHSVGGHVPVPHGGARHHQEPDGVKIVEASWLCPVLWTILQPGVSRVLQQVDQTCKPGQAANDIGYKLVNRNA